MWLHTVSQYN
ncbi:Protein of unknown function [Pyronema omphalodes CBS 100304]|uniref:Uncharacterized protein n=1 Tax=Pyronema omphalodes (strain CBS 100304) TaxID=1076935 RepID=U4LST3_PYROM|nr:Protein of unknown function [Pyronema omphalodes CBS 100304]